MTQLEPTLNNLLQELRELIDETRTKIAAAAWFSNLSFGLKTPLQIRTELKL
jgi:hypothetical protein